MYGVRASPDINKPQHRNEQVETGVVCQIQYSHRPSGPRPSTGPPRSNVTIVGMNEQIDRQTHGWAHAQLVQVPTYLYIRAILPRKIGRATRENFNAADGPLVSTDGAWLCLMGFKIWDRWERDAPLPCGLSTGLETLTKKKKKIFPFPESLTWMGSTCRRNWVHTRPPIRACAGYVPPTV